MADIPYLEGNHPQIADFADVMDPTAGGDGVETISDDASFVAKWAAMWRDHDGGRWQDLMLEGGVLRNPLGDLSRDDLPGWMSGLVAGITNHEITALRWGSTEDGVLIEWLMTGQLGATPLEIRGVDRFTLKDGLIAEGVAYFDPAPFLARPAPAAPAESGVSARTFDIETFAREYDQAWQAKDPDAITARHAVDGTYQLHVAGLPAVDGRAAMRETFAASLANWRDLTFSFDRAFYGDRFYVWQSTISGVLTQPLALGAITLPANGERLSFRGIDVITIDDDGLISSKETHFDLVDAANQAGGS